MHKMSSSRAHSVFSVVLFAVLISFGDAVSKHRILPAPSRPIGRRAIVAPQSLPRNRHNFNRMEGGHTMGGVATRQSEDNRPVCDQFRFSYAQVRKATLFLRRRVAPSEKRYVECMRTCIACSKCTDERKPETLSGARKCIDKYGFLLCAVGLAMLERQDDVSYTCRFYLKESRVGNCFAEEYLTLNGLKGGKDKKRLVFNREVGFYGKKRFQCRAGRRARLPDLKNQHICRSKFRLSAQQVFAVVRCAFPEYTKAFQFYNLCVSSTFNLFVKLACYEKFAKESDAAYINCMDPHGAPAVAVASISIGSNALNCPVLRRDSYVGPCKAPDFADLVRLDLAELKPNYIKILLSGACSYKKK